MQEFRRKLEDLEDAIQNIQGELVVAGDFNSRACEWGMQHTNTRGRLVLEMASRLGLYVVNRGNTTTYRRPGYGESIPDITLASERQIIRISDWEVLNVYTGSDHEYISFNIRDRSNAHKVKIKRQGWDLRKIDRNKLVQVVNDGWEEAVRETARVMSLSGAERLVDSSMELIRRACDAAMPRKKTWNGRPQAYFWTEYIASLRKKCLRLRRRAQRASSARDVEERNAAFKLAKKELNKEIKRSKARCWRELCAGVDQDPWGKGYKLAMKKLQARCPTSPMNRNVAEKIVEALFPTHPERTERPINVDAESIPLFNEEELTEAVANLKNKKAPGPDGIPSEVLKIVADCCPQLLLRMFNACLTAGHFATRWKLAKLVMVEKGKGGDPELPSSYRPLCMLDVAGKLLEKLVKTRLQSAISDGGELSHKQHGFRAGHSTISAVKEVTEEVFRVRLSSHRTRSIVMLVTLDVKNAFNSLRWTDVMDALENNFKIPEYLLRIIDDYLRDRTLTYVTKQGLAHKVLTAGAAQGSVLGPDLWNICYDGLLRTDMPKDTFLVGYADDIAVVITERNAELAQLKLNQVMRRVGGWMKSHGLQLALAKTEIVLLTRKRIETCVAFKLEETDIQSQPSVRYLGITLDTKLNFGEQIRRSCDKASAMSAYLSRLMANTSGPSPIKRRLLIRVAESVMLYGAEVWAEALKIKKYRIRMASIQRRGALRVTCAYRTVSEPAALLIAGMIPIDLLAMERKLIFERREGMSKKEAAPFYREQTMGQWQRRWSGDPRGRWTARLIPDLKPWIERRHGEVNFYVTQFLSGHGYFRKYLHRMGKVGSPLCIFCGEEDDAQHTFFSCPQFSEERVELERDLGGCTPSTVIEKMLQREEYWLGVNAYVEKILRKKKLEGCLE